MKPDFKEFVTAYFEQASQLSEIERRTLNAKVLSLCPQPAFLLPHVKCEKHISIMMAFGIVSKMDKKHNLGADIMGRLPELVANGVALYRSTTQPGAFVLETSEIRTINEQEEHVLVCIEPNGQLDRHSKACFITSVYSKPLHVFEGWNRDGLKLWSL